MVSNIDSNGTPERGIMGYAVRYRNSDGQYDFIDDPWSETGDEIQVFPYCVFKARSEAMLAAGERQLNDAEIIPIPAPAAALDEGSNRTSAPGDGTPLYSVWHPQEGLDFYEETNTELPNRSMVQGLTVVAGYEDAVILCRAKGEGWQIIEVGRLPEVPAKVQPPSAAALALLQEKQQRAASA